MTCPPGVRCGGIMWLRSEPIMQADHCFVCGKNNPAGLRARFEVSAEGTVRTRCVGQEEHQGYPGRMHGGVIAALLEEVAARAAGTRAAGADSTVRELRVRYRQPVPLSVELVARGRPGTTGEDAAIAELLLPDGTVAAEARLRYLAVGSPDGEAPQPGRSWPDGHAVVQKQPNSRMCFVCGTGNCAGLHVRFYERDDNSVLARFVAADHHADHTGHVSLAAVAAAMDEAMGRAIMIPYGEAIWGVTAELSFRLLQPLPVGVELISTGRITAERSRLFEGSGELWLPDGTLAVVGYGRYVKLDMVALGGFDPEREEWGVRPD